MNLPTKNIPRKITVSKWVTPILTNCSPRLTAKQTAVAPKPCINSSSTLKPRLEKILDKREMCLNQIEAHKSIACIAEGIAQAFYKEIPSEIISKARKM